MSNSERGRSHMEEPVRATAIPAPSIIPSRNFHSPLSPTCPTALHNYVQPSLSFRSSHAVFSLAGANRWNRQLYITSPSTFNWDHEASSVRWNPRRVPASGNSTCRVPPVISLNGVTGRSGFNTIMPRITHCSRHYESTI